MSEKGSGNNVSERAYNNINLNTLSIDRSSVGMRSRTNTLSSSKLPKGTSSQHLSVDDSQSVENSNETLQTRRKKLISKFSRSSGVVKTKSVTALAMDKLPQNATIGRLQNEYQKPSMYPPHFLKSSNDLSSIKSTNTLPSNIATRSSYGVNSRTGTMNSAGSASSPRATMRKGLMNSAFESSTSVLKNFAKISLLRRSTHDARVTASLNQEELRELEQRKMESAIDSKLIRQFLRDENESSSSLKLFISEFKDIVKDYPSVNNIANLSSILSVLNEIFIIDIKLLAKDNMGSSFVAEEIEVFFRYLSETFDAGFRNLRNNILTIQFALRLLKYLDRDAAKIIFKMIDERLEQIIKPEYSVFQRQSVLISVRSLIFSIVQQSWLLRESDYFSLIERHLKNYLNKLKNGIIFQSHSNASPDSHVNQYAGWFFQCLSESLKTSDIILKIWILTYFSEELKEDEFNVLDFQSEHLIFCNSIKDVLTSNTSKALSQQAAIMFVLSSDYTLAGSCINLLIQRFPPEIFDSLQSGLQEKLTSTILKLLEKGSFHYETREIMIDSDEHRYDISEDQTCSPKDIFLIVEYVKKMLQISENFIEVLINHLHYYFEESEPSKIVTVYKRFIVDIGSYANDILYTTYQNFIFNVNRKMAVEISEWKANFKYLLSIIFISWPNIFFEPILRCCTENDPEKIAESLQNLYSVVILLGEIRVWFGIDSSIPYHTSSLKRKESEKNNDNLSVSHDGASSFSQHVPDMPSSLIVQRRFVDLLAICILGNDLLRNQDDTVAEMKLGHFCIIMEVIWTLRRIRIAHKYGLIAFEIKDSILTALHSVEKIICAVSQAKKSKISQNLKILLLNVMAEIKLFEKSTNVPPYYDFNNICMDWLEESIKDLENLYISDLSKTISSVKSAYQAGIDLIYNPDLSENLQLIANVFKSRIDGFNCKSLTRTRMLVEDLVDSSIAMLCLNHSSLSVNQRLKLLELCWDNLLNLTQSMVRKMSLLLMFVAETCPEAFRSHLDKNLRNDDPQIRFNSIKKMSILFFQRRFITEFLHPHEVPIWSDSAKFISTDAKIFSNTFKAPLVNLPFVPPDLGSDDFAMANEPDWLFQLKETARRMRKNDTSKILKMQRGVLSSNQNVFGGESEEQNSERRRRIETILTLLPSTFLVENYEIDPKSSKFKAIFPTAMASFCYTITDLLQDEFAPIRILSQDVAWNIIRDDCSVFLRYYFERIVSSPLESKKKYLTRLQRLISGKKNIPASFAYSLFNYLMGYIRWIVSSVKENQFEIIQAIIPVVSDLVVAVQGLGLKDFRKIRLENATLSAGNFWFNEKYAQGIFPVQNSRSTEAFDTMSRFKFSRIVLKNSLLRTSQIQLMIQLLLKAPYEVNSIRKFLKDYKYSELSTQNEEDSSSNSASMLSEFAFDLSKDKVSNYGQNYVECNQKFAINDEESYARSIIGMERKMWLSFLDIMFMFINKSMSSTAELSSLVSDVNWTLLKFHHDHCIARQCLVFYINIVTRMKRLFAKKAYGFFLKPLFEYYVLISDSNQPDYAAQISVKYCFRRFYDLHEESFMLQLFSFIIPYILKKDGDIQVDECLSYHPTKKQIYLTALLKDLLDSLSMDFTKGDPLRVSASAISLEAGKFDVSVFYSKKYLFCEDVIKILVTSIAYNPESVMSYQLMCFLRLYLIVNLSDIPQISATSPSKTNHSFIMSSTIALIWPFYRVANWIKLGSSSISNNANEKTKLHGLGLLKARITVFNLMAYVNNAIIEFDGPRSQPVLQMLTRENIDQLMILARVMFRESPANIKLIETEWFVELIESVIKITFLREKSRSELEIVNQLYVEDKYYQGIPVVHSDAALNLIASLIRNCQFLIKNFYKTHEVCNIIDELANIAKILPEDHELIDFIHDKIFIPCLSYNWLLEEKSGEIMQEKFCRSLVKLGVQLTLIGKNSVSQIISLRPMPNGLFISNIIVDLITELGLRYAELQKSPLQEKKKVVITSIGLLMKYLLRTRPSTTNIRKTRKGTYQSKHQKVPEVKIDIKIDGETTPSKLNADQFPEPRVPEVLSIWRRNDLMVLFCIKHAIRNFGDIFNKHYPGLWFDMSNFIMSHFWHEESYAGHEMLFNSLLESLISYPTPMKIFIGRYASDRIGFIAGNTSLQSLNRL